MNKYLIDPIILLDFINRDSKAETIIRSIYKSRLYLSILHWIEIEHAIKTAYKGEKKLEEFRQFCSELNLTILPIDKHVSEIFVQLKIDTEKKGQFISNNDLLIISSAVANNCVYVTRNKNRLRKTKALQLYK